MKMLGIRHLRARAVVTSPDPSVETELVARLVDRLRRLSMTVVVLMQQPVLFRGVENRVRFVLTYISNTCGAAGAVPPP